MVSRELKVTMTTETRGAGSTSGAAVARGATSVPVTSFRSGRGGVRARETPGSAEGCVAIVVGGCVRVSVAGIGYLGYPQSVITMTQCLVFGFFELVLKCVAALA